MPRFTLNDPKIPQTWHQADSLLTELNRDEVRNLCHNTHLYRHNNGDIGVMYHDTEIVTYFYPTGTYIYCVRLNSGGWQTVTTKQRMNLFTNVRVWQRDHQWFVTEPKLRSSLGYGPNKYVWFGQDDDNERTMPFGDRDIYLNEP